MADFKYEFKKEIALLSENAKGWRKEINIIPSESGLTREEGRQET